jgi:hypothetical protein
MTHLFLHLLPIIISKLEFLAITRDPASLQTLATMIHKTAAWCLRGHACSVCQKRVKRYKKPVRDNKENDKTTSKMRMYLFPRLFASHKVGCCNEMHLQHFCHPYSKDPCLLNLQGATTQPGQLPPVQFELDLFPIGINNHATRCMANSPHLFEDLCLTSNREQVDEISEGLEIQGEGMFKFSIEDNKGRVHTIKIPNSLYLSELRQCLLSSQHWAQEAGGGQTWM